MPANGRWPYADPQWYRGVRLLVLARDGYTCTARGQGPHWYGKRGPDVDHIIPADQAPSLAFDPANLTTLCRLHHNRKTHRTKRRNTRRW